MEYLKNKLILSVFIIFIISNISNVIYLKITRGFGGLFDNLFGFFDTLLVLLLFLLIMREKKRKQKVKNKKLF